jgi:hypothetical protein
VGRSSGHQNGALVHYQNYVSWAVMIASFSFLCSCAIFRKASLLTTGTMLLGELAITIAISPRRRPHVPGGDRLKQGTGTPALFASVQLRRYLKGVDFLEAY